MPTRRTVTATGVALLSGLAGCSQYLDDATNFEASKGTVPASVREDTGYEKATVEPVTIERTFEAGGQSQTVTVTNWQARYEKQVELPPPIGEVEGAIFSVLSTPQVNILGKEFNPVAKFSHEELAQQVQQRYDQVSELNRVGETQKQLLGTSATIGRFEGRARIESLGQSVDVVVQVSAAVEHGQDFVLAIGAYPKVSDAVEASNVFSLVEAVEH